MKKTNRQMMPMLAVLVLATAGRAISIAGGAPPKPKGQEVHLFEATVLVPDHFPYHGAEDYDEFNYGLLAVVLGSVEAARSVTFETYPGMFSAFLTNNQTRRLSKVPGVEKVKQRDDTPTDG